MKEKSILKKTTCNKISQLKIFTENNVKVTNTEGDL